ncbi:MAG: phosphoribosyltransferase [Patescibacteria group bacterium]
MDRPLLWKPYTPEEMWEMSLQAGMVRNDRHIALRGGHTPDDANFVPGFVPAMLRYHLVSALTRKVLSMQKAPLFDGHVMVGFGKGHFYATQTAMRFGIPMFELERDRYGDFVFMADQARGVWGKKIFLIDDVIVTGQSLQQAVIAIERCGGVIGGAAALLLWTNESIVLPTLRCANAYAPILNVFNKPMTLWTASACPPCKDGIHFSTAKAPRYSAFVANP